MGTENLNSEPVMVTIRCITFNQSCYIRDCLDGFVMQKTNFRFEAIVHDDASTDGNAEIIKEYGEKYPNIIKPILEKENQWSKHDGSLGRIMNENTRGKYLAWCEGDDYWIDPLKLQKQVDFLEAHPDYSMCWSDAYIETNGHKAPYKRYSGNCQSPISDIIEKGGAFIPTCSIVARREVVEKMPSTFKGFFVGDYPLQIWCGAMGKCFYFKDQTCVYRYMAQGSWTQKNNGIRILDAFWRCYNGEKDIIERCNKALGYKYNKSFEIHAAKHMYKLCMLYKQYHLAKPYMLLREKYHFHVGKAEKAYILGHHVLGSILSFAISFKNKVLFKVKDINEE